MDERKSAGVWIKVSTVDQARGDSPELHRARALDYAKLRGWEVVEIYDLSGVSGKAVLEHPATQLMLADVRSGRISGLEARPKWLHPGSGRNGEQTPLFNVRHQLAGSQSALPRDSQTRQDSRSGC